MASGHSLKVDALDDSAPWSLWDLIDMRDELSSLFQRQVDLVEKKAIKNPFLRHDILKDVEIIYDATQDG